MFEYKTVYLVFKAPLYILSVTLKIEGLLKKRSPLKKNLHFTKNLSLYEHCTRHNRTLCLQYQCRAQSNSKEEAIHDLETPVAI